jgi:hypothetical protein
MKNKNNPILLSLGLALTLIFCLSDFTEDSFVNSNESQDETQVYEYQSNDAALTTFSKQINELNT